METELELPASLKGTEELLKLLFDEGIIVNKEQIQLYLNLCTKAEHDGLIEMKFESTYSDLYIGSQRQDEDLFISWIDGVAEKEALISDKIDEIMENEES